MRLYTVMVTGGIGSGKSTLRKLFTQHGAVSIDLDAIARTLLENEPQMIAELVDEFGTRIMDRDGSIDRAALAAAAFASPQATEAMNAITFPYIIREATEYVLNVHCTPRTDSPALVIEVPLLLEAPEFAALADEIIAVQASSDLRLQRCVARGMDAADALARMDRQATDAERAEAADTICPNDGSEEELAAWVDAWWDAHFASNV